MRQRVLFVCTHNSARSQMAEALLWSMSDDRFEVASAGTQNTSVNPLAIRVMEEVGLDLTTHTSKVVDDFVGQPWDYVITVCDDAKERCPALPERTKRLHFSVSDRSAVQGSEDHKLNEFRWTRDLIRELVLPAQRGRLLIKIGSFLALAAVSAGITWRMTGRGSAALTAFVLTLVLAWLSWWK